MPQQRWCMMGRADSAAVEQLDRTGVAVATTKVVRDGEGRKRGRRAARCAQ